MALQLRSLQCAFADEIARRFQVHRPRETGFERRGGLVHVLAVETHASFEPQRVARAEPGRRNIELAQPLP